jgi:hypothetical protein
MIDHIHHRCITWGRRIRQIYLGKDGWPSRSILGKLSEEGVLGASATRLVQSYSEVLTGEALETACAIKVLDEESREVLFVHYVVIGKGKTKAYRLGISRDTYYERLHRAHWCVDRVLSMDRERWHPKPTPNAKSAA